MIIQEASKNYNVNRVTDNDTEAFEEELEKLLSKYEADCEVETFPSTNDEGV